MKITLYMQTVLQHTKLVPVRAGVNKSNRPEYGREGGKAQ